VPLGPLYGDVLGGAGTKHALTRSVRDSALLLDLTTGPDLGEPYPARHSLGRSSTRLVWTQAGCASPGAPGLREAVQTTLIALGRYLKLTSGVSPGRRRAG
jgi:Asp-tRNA(Asn)/Glu-tRNA(Gln) amidotransferase A subunit family amidase